MSWTLIAAIYFILWWVALLAVLPFGVRTQGEAGDVVPGTPQSAPAAPRLKRIVALATGVSAIAFAFVYAALGTVAGQRIVARLFERIGPAF